MSWLGRPEVKILEYKSGAEESYCTASHNAFQQDQVEICRTVFLDRKNRKLRIKDQVNLKENNPVKMDFYLHFHPKIRLSKGEKDQFLLKLEDKELRLEGEGIHESQLISENKELPLGWFSPQFGIKIPTNTLIRSESIDKSKVLITEIHY